MRDILTSPRIEDLKRKRRRRRFRLIILLSILFIAIIGGLAFFSSHGRVTINNVVISGTSIIDASLVESKVKDKLTGRYLYLFARSNSFIYPKKQIYNVLINEFPRIETLSISRNKLNTLEVKISERSGAHLYCGENVPEAISDVGENCYFINNDGYIFDKAPYFSGNVYFKYYIAPPLGNVLLGQNIMDIDRFHSIIRFIDGIKSLKFNPTHLVVDRDGTHSLYLEPSANSNPPKIIFRAGNDLPAILENLSIAIAKQEFAKEINSKYATLLYIDLRFKNKVLYKFQ